MTEHLASTHHLLLSIKENFLSMEIASSKDKKKTPVI
jgi:hypothetical protein